jgi:hypothetical protein
VATKTRVPVRGTIGKSVKLNVGTVTQTQLIAAIAAIPKATVTAAVSSGSGTVTSVTLAAGSANIVLTGTNPITAAGTITIDLSATAKADLALAATSLQAGAIQFNEAAGWNSTSGAIQVALTVAQDVLIPYACTLQEVYIVTQGGTGSCTVSLKTAAFPSVPSSDITGGTSPAIVSGASYSNTSLSGWTTAFAQGALIRATLTVNTVFTSVKIILRFA